MPKRIFVCWQSVVEPQMYKVWVDLPDEARRLLQTSTSRRYSERPDSLARAGASLIIGLTPGGVVVCGSRTVATGRSKLLEHWRKWSPWDLIWVKPAIISTRKQKRRNATLSATAFPTAAGKCSARPWIGQEGATCIA
ncbi:DUF2931 family protein [Pseudomonas sp. MDT1-17]